MNTIYGPAGPVTAAGDALWAAALDQYNLVATCAICGRIGGWLRNHVILWPYKTAAPEIPSPVTYLVVVAACSTHAPEDVAQWQPPSPKIP